MVQLLQQLLEEAAAKGTRSSALQPLLWLFGIISAAIAALVKANAPIFIQGIAVFIWAAVAVLIAAVFLYLLVKDPDALRSERFTMYKMAMEKSLIGDNIYGLVKPSDNQGVLENKSVNVEGKPL